MIELADVLASPALAAADPVLRTAIAGTAERPVRWVHSSEVLEIAPLLKGGELLLSGGQALLELPAGEQVRYMRSLGARGVAALAIQTAGRTEPLSPEIIAAAESCQVPLIELRRVVPFVDVAEDVNRRIVDERARAHLLVDEISRRIAREITDRGPHLPTILELVATALNAEATLTSPDGVNLGRAGTAADQAAEAVVSGIVVGGQLAAEFTLRSTARAPVELEVAANNLSGILSLAMAQTFHPSPARVADARLLQAVIEGAVPAGIGSLWVRAGLPAGRQAGVAVFRGLGRSNDYSGVERALRGTETAVKAQLWDGDLVVLYVLPAAGARGARLAFVEQARGAVLGTGITAVVGPHVHDGHQAHASYVEALEVLRIGAPSSGHVLDAMEFLGRRVLDAVAGAGFLEGYIQATLGEVLQWDRAHGTSLALTLLRWLELGCNTTATALALHIERQTMHKRLNKIQELLGEDPRESGNLFALHLGVMAALSTTAQRRGRR